MKPVISVLLAFSLGAVSPLSVDDNPSAAPPPLPRPQNWTHRVTGLFSPDREADLRAALEQIPGVQLVSLDFAHAEAVFAYDPAAAFKEAKPEKAFERLNEVLGKATRRTLGIAPLNPTPHDQLTRVEIPVIGLDCKACALAAYESVYKIEGVAAATVDFHEGRVTAQIDPAKTDQPALEAALKKRGVGIKPPP